jgi:hypothetical protein
LYGLDYGLAAVLASGYLSANVWSGSRLSASAPDIVVRPILVFVLAVSAMKLLNFSNTSLLVGLIVLAIALPPIWVLIAQTRARPRLIAAAAGGESLPLPQRSGSVPLP